MFVAYIILNGELLGDKTFYKNFINENEGDIFCADGGANIAYSLDLVPLEIWGDLDSINKEILENYSDNKVIIKKFPSEKDETDSELLISYLTEKEYEKIYCIAGLGGALEHELTNLNLCFKYKNLVFLTQEQIIFSIHEKYNFKNLKDKKISFIIYSDEVKNLNLSGFKYNAQNLNLKRGDSRCISNIINENSAEISFESGSILCIIRRN